MTVYYRGPDALITQDTFLSWQPIAREFPIRELSNVRVARGDQRPARVVTGYAVAAALIVAGASGAYLPGAGPAALATVLFLAFAVALTVVWRLRPRERQLWATYHGGPVLLYSSPDMTRFGQVSRGLIRSLEWSYHSAE